MLWAVHVLSDFYYVSIRGDLGGMFVYSFPCGEAGRCPLSVNAIQKVTAIIISINISPFWLFLNIVSGVIPHVFFCVFLCSKSMILRSIHVTCLRNESLCRIPLCECTSLLIHSRVEGLALYLAHGYYKQMLLGILLCRYFGGHENSYLLVVCPGAELPTDRHLFGLHRHYETVFPGGRTRLLRLAPHCHQ